MTTTISNIETVQELLQKHEGEEVIITTNQGELLQASFTLAGEGLSLMMLNTVKPRQLELKSIYKTLDDRGVLVIAATKLINA